MTEEWTQSESSLYTTRKACHMSIMWYNYLRVLMSRNLQMCGPARLDPRADLPFRAVTPASPRLPRPAACDVLPVQAIPQSAQDPITPVRVFVL